MSTSGLSENEKWVVLRELTRRATIRYYVPADLIDQVGDVYEGSASYAFYDRNGNLLGTPSSNTAKDLDDAGLENVLMAAGLLRAVAGGTFRLAASALLRNEGVASAAQLEALFGVLARGSTEGGLRLEISAAQLAPELRAGLQQMRSAVGPSARRLAGEDFTAKLVGGGLRGETYAISKTEMDLAAGKLGLRWGKDSTTRIVDVTSRNGTKNILVQSESKLFSGSVRANEDIRGEIIKEAALRARLGSTYNPVWHFYQGPPGKTTQVLLEKAGIPYVIYK